MRQYKSDAFGRRHRWHGAFFALGPLAVALAGCQGSGIVGGTATRLTPRSVPYISDVPLPTGFRLVEKTTDDYVSGGTRVVRHDYQGHADRAALRNFYQEQMPNYRWTRISDQNIKGEITLRFEKANEQCTVLIRPASGDWFDSTIIRVTIMPLDRSGRDPSARTPER